MAGRQVRLEETVVSEAHRNRTALGFKADAPDGAVLTELVREGMRARLEARRREARRALYADWAKERDLVDDVEEAMRAAIKDGVA